MVHHPITACKRVPNLAQIYLVGFYEEGEFALYVSYISNGLRVRVSFGSVLCGGSAGGLCNFRDIITDCEIARSQIFLPNCDVCCSFPLPEMLEAYRRYGGMGTILVSKVSAESASQFGELVADPNTNEVLHYTEKPETFDVLCLHPIFPAANLRHVSSVEALQSATKCLSSDVVRLDQHILTPLAGKK